MGMGACVIFGGSGYIGSMLTKHFLESQKFSEIIIADLQKTSLEVNGVSFYFVDVRNPINLELSEKKVEWIFNFAAVHREPGHKPKEYFVTNILGARNVCDFAEKVGCNNLFFTASISVYGPTAHATDEYKLPMPNTPYGISKLSAEFIHQLWAQKQSKNRLIIVRPGVIYGPGDPGNILRMIKAIKKGYFFMPVKPSIKKSYGYVFGLLESIDFAMAQNDKIFIYNYVEKETESLGTLINIINSTLGYRGRIIRVPIIFLKFIATIIHYVSPNINGIHPERVKKVARPTHIVPKILIEKGFEFKYGFMVSLKHWKRLKSGDF